VSDRRSTRLPRASIGTALAIAMASLIACGGSQRGPTPAPDAGSVGPRGGAPTADGDAGPSGPGGSAPGDTGGPGTAGGGEPAPDAGGMPDRMPPILACDDLLPIFGAPTEVSFALSTYAACRVATSSPWGQVLLGRSDHEDFAFDLYSLDGANQGRISGITGWSTLLSRPDVDSWFSWTSDGYVGIDGRPPHVTVWDDLGARVALGPPYAVALAPDGQGGTVALTRPAGTQLWWLDPWAHRIRSVDVDGSPSMLLVAWGTHHVLTVETSETRARARWYDATGAPITSWVELGSDFLETTPGMHLLVDGSIALATGGQWRLVLRDGAQAADPAPAWLASLSSSRLATIRDGSGYAVLAPDGKFDVLEIVTAQGERCGAISVPSPGEPWYPSRIDVGQDGTLVETVNQPPRSSPTVENAGGACEFRWWPALLR
jgi:hypothetical protein